MISQGECGYICCRQQWLAMGLSHFCTVYQPGPTQPQKLCTSWPIVGPIFRARNLKRFPVYFFQRRHTSRVQWLLNNPCHQFGVDLMVSCGVCCTMDVQPWGSTLPRRWRTLAGGESCTSRTAAALSLRTWLRSTTSRKGAV